MRRVLPAVSLGFFAVAAVLFGSALSLDSTVPLPATAAYYDRTIVSRETVVVTETPTTVPTRAPTPTREPLRTPSPGSDDPCIWSTQDGTVCTWATSTQTLPLPDCVTPVGGQKCVWTARKMTPIATVTPTPRPPTATPEPTSVFAGRETDGRSETR